MQPLNADSGSSEKVDTGAKINMTRAELYPHLRFISVIYDKYTHSVAKIGDA